MKKIIICFLCAVILVSVLASCGKETDAGAAGTPETTEVPDTAEVPETTEAPLREYASGRAKAQRAYGI